MAVYAARGPVQLIVDGAVAYSELVRSPSERLKSWIQQTIDEQRPSTGLGDWPRDVGRQHRVLLIHGDNLVLWFIAPTGALFSLDTDTVSRCLDPEPNPEVIRRVLTCAVERFPELRELLEP